MYGVTSIIVFRLVIEKLVALRCARAPKNWNESSKCHAREIVAREHRVSRLLGVYSMNVPLSKRRSIEICLDCSWLTSASGPIKLSFQITFTFMIGKFYKADRNGNCAGLRALVFAKNVIKDGFLQFYIFPIFFYTFQTRAITVSGRGTNCANCYQVRNEQSKSRNPLFGIC